MIKLLNLLLTTILIVGCQSIQQSSYHNLPKPVNIAILLPLSHDKAYQRWNELIYLGLQDGAARNINVISYDISNEKTIDTTMQKVLAAKTNIILGPVTSDITNQVANIAKKHNIITISLSNDPSLAQQDVYVFGHSPLQQTKKLLNSLNQQGFSNIIFLLPNNRKSNNLANALSDIAMMEQMTVLSVVKYSDTLDSTNPNSINQKIKLVNRIINDSMLSDNNKVALYVADDADKLTTLFDVIKQHRLDEQAIICGENKIDIKYPKGINLLFTGWPEGAKVSSIMSRMNVNYLNFWDKLAYDLGIIVSYAIGVEDFNKAQFIEKLNNSSGYVGMSGRTTILDYAATRQYQIIKRSGMQYNAYEGNER